MRQWKETIDVDNFSEDFTSGVKPPNWKEWNNLENHASTWNAGGVVLKHNDPNYATGAFCQLPFGESRDILVKFQLLVNRYPDQITEIIDLYDGAGTPGLPDGQEVCDTYLEPSGKIYFHVQGTQVRTQSKVPIALPFNIWVRYVPPISGPTYGSVAFSTTDLEPVAGPQFVCRQDGPYNTSIKQFLFGPMADNSTIFTYDRVVVSSFSSPHK